MTEIPQWADYVVLTRSAELAVGLERSGTVLGGLRIMHLGGGAVALDATAVRELQAQPADAEGCIDDCRQMWLAGDSYPVQPVSGIEADPAAVGMLLSVDEKGGFSVPRQLR